MPPASCIRYVGILAYVKVFWHLLVMRVSHLFWRTETKSAEITYGLIAIGWCVVLSVFDTFSIGNLYVYLERWASQQVWAAVMAMLGLSQLILAITLPMKSHRLVRSGVWLVSMILWSYIAWVALLAIPVTTAVAAYGTLALGSLWAFLRSGEGR